MNEWQHIVVLLLSAVGFFCAGTVMQMRRTLYWRIKWIELEHDSARQLGREPRDISAVDAMNTIQTHTSGSRHPICSPLGLCPGCGAVESDGWVDGWHGWICGSKNLAHHGHPLRFDQSMGCAVSHWRIRAERAESRLRKLDEANGMDEGQRTQDTADTTSNL